MLDKELNSSKEEFSQIGLQFQRLEQRDREIGGRKVFVYDLRIDPSKCHFLKERNRGVEEDDNILKTYEEIQMDTFSSIENIGESWREVVKREDVCFYILMEGLSSNHQEWDRKGASTINTLVKQHCQYFPKSDFVILTLSSPGAGGSKKKNEKEVTPDDVDALAGAKLIRGVELIIGLPDDQLVIAGHSKGGENLVSYSVLFPQSKARLVLFNPSVRLAQGLYKHFLQLGLLNQLGQMKVFDKYLVPSVLRKTIATDIMNKLVGSEESFSLFQRLRQKILELFISFPEGKGEEKGAGKEDIRSQVVMHVEETEAHPQVVIASCIALFTAENPVKPQDIRRLFPTVISQKDGVTPGGEDWFNAYINALATKMENWGLVFDEEGKKKEFFKYLRRKSLMMVPVVHDGIMFDQKAQEKAMSLVVGQARRQQELSQRNIRPFAKIIKRLKERGIKIHLDYKGVNYGKMSNPLDLASLRNLLQHLKEIGLSSETVDKIEKIAQRNIKEIPVPKIYERLMAVEMLLNYAEIEGIVVNWRNYQEFSQIPKEEIKKVIHNYCSSIINQQPVKEALSTYLQSDKEDLETLIDGYLERIYQNGFEGNVLSDLFGKLIFLNKPFDGYPYSTVENWCYEEESFVKSSNAKAALLFLITGIEKKKINFIKQAAEKFENFHQKRLAMIDRGVKSSIIPVNQADLVDLIEELLAIE